MADIQLPFQIFPDERGLQAAAVKARRGDERSDKLRGGYLTNHRVVAYDATEGVVFSHRYKEIQRAELDKSFWQGWAVKLYIEGGAVVQFQVVMSMEAWRKLSGGDLSGAANASNLTGEDRDLNQRWCNTINELVLVQRPRG